MQRVEGNGSVRERFRDHTGVTSAMERGVRAALRRHMLLGESVVVSENGRVRTLTPDEIRVRLDTKTN